MKKFEIVTNDITKIIAATKAAPEEKKIIGELISERRITLFPSERGLGKTMFLLQMLFAIGCDIIGRGRFGRFHSLQILCAPAQYG